MVLSIFWMFGFSLGLFFLIVGALLSIDYWNDFRNVIGASMAFGSSLVLAIMILNPMQSAHSSFEIAMTVLERIV